MIEAEAVPAASADPAVVGRGEASAATSAGPPVSARYRVTCRTVEATDVVTLTMEPFDAPLPTAQPGQFMVLTVPDVGQATVPVSGLTTGRGSLSHTIRAADPVTDALHAARLGTLLAVTGPFGTGWDLTTAAGRDLVVVAGGMGLAPLRPALLAALANRPAHRRIVLIVGARTPNDVLYLPEVAAWSERTDLEVELVVDQSTVGWRGPVGFVTEPLTSLSIDATRTTALVSGPIPMMRFAAWTLLDRGVAPADVFLWLTSDVPRRDARPRGCRRPGPGPEYRFGPVVTYDVAEPLLAARDLTEERSRPADTSMDGSISGCAPWWGPGRTNG